MPQLRSGTRTTTRAKITARRKASKLQPATPRSTRRNVQSDTTTPALTLDQDILDTGAFLSRNAPTDAVVAAQFTVSEHAGSSTTAQNPGSSDNAAQGAMHEVPGGKAQDPEIDNVGAHLTNNARSGHAIEPPATSVEDNSGTFDDVTATQSTVMEHAGGQSNSISFGTTAIHAAVTEHAGSQSNTSTPATATQAVEYTHLAAPSLQSLEEQVLHATVVNPSSGDTGAANEVMGSGYGWTITSTGRSGNSASNGTWTPQEGGNHSDNQSTSHDPLSPASQNVSCVASEGGGASGVISPGSTSRKAADRASSSQIRAAWDWAYTDGQAPQDTETNCIMVDLPDFDDGDENIDDNMVGPVRDSKTRGSQQQTRDSHVALTMKALDELAVQVQQRAGVNGRGKRSLWGFFEIEKGATDKTILDLKALLMDVERYGKNLKKSRV